jgi:hypothetical protein
MDRQTDRLSDRKTNTFMNRQAGKQWTDPSTHTYTHNSFILAATFTVN